MPELSCIVCPQPLCTHQIPRHNCGSAGSCNAQPRFSFKLFRRTPHGCQSGWDPVNTFLCGHAQLVLALSFAFPREFIPWESICSLLMYWCEYSLSSAPEGGTRMCMRTGIEEYDRARRARLESRAGRAMPSFAPSCSRAGTIYALISDLGPIV